MILGQDNAGAGAVQIGVATLKARPTKAALEELWKSRGTKAPMGFIVAAVTTDGVWIHYPSAGAPTIGPVTVGQAERQLQSVLDESNGLAAHGRIRAIQEAMSSAGTDGFSNHFLFATYHLNRDVPLRADWDSAGEKAAPILSRRGPDLVSALGFDSEPVGSDRVLVLRTATGPRRAVAVLLRDDEHFDQKSATYQLTPVAKALEIAGREDVPWVIALRKSTLRLYPGRDGVGVGQRGQSETYFELDLDLLAPEQAALLTLIFSADALDAGGSAQQILDGSGKYAADLGTRLRDRVYEGVVPRVALAIADQLPSLGLALDAHGLQTAYHLTMRILFRLLFQAYGEAAELLPAGRNSHYDANSLQAFISREIGTRPDEFSTESAAIWSDLTQVWEVIFHGNSRWEVPTYGGSLFDPATEEGDLLTRLRLTDSVLGPALQELLSENTVDETKGPVDFRSLQVREFGTIYEGLLESSLSLAEQDLTIDKKGVYLPAKDGEEVFVPAGRPYFHSASGERKATGSYYTPKIVVDHLIERSIEPALKIHLDRVKALMDEGKDRQASDAFFDFRVADLAMGSAHFLVAAVDKIERGMRDFLTATDVPGVRAELSRLSEKAREALGQDVEGANSITDGQLLRRQVARRCIYGLDINPLAVELSQLALWIHTFVPGLPMSNLEHGLVCANSLTGIGTIDEAIDALVGTSPVKTSARSKKMPDVGLLAEVDSTPRESGYQQMLRRALKGYLEEALPLLRNVANATEASRSEVTRGAEMLADAQKKADPARRVFDAAVAKRMGAWTVEITREEHIGRLVEAREPAEIVAPLRPAHLPALFPEVFLREQGGFDVVIGNPPWEKVRWEAAPFWAKVAPGLMALPDTARDAQITRLREDHPDLAAHEQREMTARTQLQEYFKKAFTWRGGTHLELAQLMLERALRSTSREGHVSLVLPRQLLVLAGWSKLRKRLLDEQDLVLVQARNRAEWLFTGVHASYAVVLLSAGPATGAPVRVGVVTSPAELVAVLDDGTIDIPASDLASYSDGLVVPWFNSPDDRVVFDKLRAHPRLRSADGWVQAQYESKWDFTGSGRDAHLASGSYEEGGYRVLMTRHVTPFAIADAIPQKQFVNSRAALANLDRGIVCSGGQELLTEHSTIVIRRPSRSDDTRTVIATALPDAGWLPNNGSVHTIAVLTSASPQTILALLGLLNSVSLDWWARRFVDRHVTAPVVNNLPIPAWDEERVERVAALVAELLRRSGHSKLAGGVDLSKFTFRDAVDVEISTAGLRAEVDAIVAIGYGLDADDIGVVAEDFSEKGLPGDYVARVQRLMAEGNADD